MIPDPNETKKVDGFQLDVSPSPPRNAKQNKQQRKKTAWVVWGSVCAVLGIVAALVGIGAWLLPGDSGSLTILPISDPVIRQGDVLRMPIPIRRAGPEQAPVTYRLGDARPGRPSMKPRAISAGRRPKRTNRARTR
jgi:hypothetical protein